MLVLILLQEEDDNYNNNMYIGDEEAIASRESSTRNERHSRDRDGLELAHTLDRDYAGPEGARSRDASSLSHEPVTFQDRNSPESVTVQGRESLYSEASLAQEEDELAEISELDDDDESTFSHQSDLESESESESERFDSRRQSSIRDLDDDDDSDEPALLAAQLQEEMQPRVEEEVDFAEELGRHLLQFNGCSATAHQEADTQHSATVQGLDRHRHVSLSRYITQLREADIPIVINRTDFFKLAQREEHATPNWSRAFEGCDAAELRERPDQTPSREDGDEDEDEDGDRIGSGEDEDGDQQGD
jgi:hypothetical protein